MDDVRTAVRLTSMERRLATPKEMIRIVFDLERRLIGDVQSLDRVFVGQEGSCDGRGRSPSTRGD